MLVAMFVAVVLVHVFRIGVRMIGGMTVIIGAGFRMFLVRRELADLVTFAGAEEGQAGG